MAKASRTIEVPVPREILFDVIVDYEAYPEFISTLSGARSIKKTKSIQIVEFSATLVKAFKYTLELKERRPSAVTWKLVDGDFMKKNDGAWKLKSLGADRTEATYEIEVGLSPLVPGFLTKILVEESLPKTLKEFSDRAKAKFRAKKR